MRITKLLPAVLLGAMALGGCLPAGRMDIPKDFVHVEESQRPPYEVRGISADGVVVGLRTRENLKKGTLAFWREAVGSELVARGYQLQKEQDITSAGGHEGTLMTFTTRSRGATFRYLLAMYVTDSRVLLAEAGGKDDVVGKHAEAIVESLRSVR
ncbi:MAG: hypothetical protein ACLFV7_09425 [Phycisphaerae bacterium]